MNKAIRNFLMLGVFAFLAISNLSSARAQTVDLHGISFLKGCSSPTVVGDPYSCAYSISNTVDTAGDTLTITSIVDVVHANPADVNSGNILPSLTLNFSGGAFCDVGQNICTLPAGSSITSNLFSFYTTDSDDPSPLADTATLTWQDLCDQQAQNCPIGNQTSTAGSQTTLVVPLEVEKSVNTSYDRNWNWTIEKTADQTNPTVQDGELVTVNYVVEVNPVSADVNHSVSGNITITNPNTVSATISSVDDTLNVSGAASVECNVAFPYVLAGGEQLVCTYTSSSDGSDTENLATVTTSGIIPGGSDTEAVSFGDPTDEVDECITVSDNNVNFPGPVVVCADDADKSIEYSVSFGANNPEADIELVCGENTHENIASFESNDTQATGQDDWTVMPMVECLMGCTLTQGYWKTHSIYGPAKKADATWDELPSGPDTVLPSGTQTWLQVFNTPVKGSVWYQLAHQWMAAYLNRLNDASVPAEVEDALNDAEAWLAGNPTSTKKNADAQSWASLLGSYNEGDIGPGHCE